MCGRDEEGTVSALRSHLNAVNSIIEAHGGHIVDTAGDGVLAEFASAVWATEAAIAIQHRVAALSGLSTDEQLHFRIGINVGDVIVEEGRLFGDGVNVAARLEQLCQPGSVLISGTVRDQLHGRTDVPFAYIGEQRLKNIAPGPVAPGLRMLVAGSDYNPIPAPQSDRPVVAVLPFDNLSGDPDQIYFSDGMTEEVVTELSRFRELTVIGRHSSAALRSKGIEIREIGRQLDATYIVEGSVRRAAGRVRIAAQLLEVATGSNLWAERFDRPLEDVFAIQEEIGQCIVAKVALRVRDDTDVRARRRQPEDLRAYDLYIQGNYLSDDWRPDAQARCERLFEEAERIDPSFARAYTGLAYVHLNRTLDRGMWSPRQPDENQREALKLAEAALELDPNDARVHSTLGFTCLYLNQVARAERHLDLARFMNPNDPTI